MGDRQGRRHRGGPDGAAASPPTSPMRATMSCLLDIVPAGGGNRNALAEGAVARMLKTDPAPFMAKADARRIVTGNIEDHLHLLGDADWIVEAVIETVDAKQAIYRKIDSARKKGSIVSSNTSTIPSRVLLDGMPAAFARDFLITHFFNPPRYMRLLEVVAGPASRADAVAAVCDFADRKLGKGVVPCNDTPGFIANRIGTYWAGRRRARGPSRTG